MSLCDVINWSIVCVLHLSVAHSHFHELASLVVLAFVIFWESGSGHGKLVHLFLGLLWHDVVGANLLLNSPEVGVLVHGGLGDWDHGVNNIPKDTLHQWCCGQRSLVSKSSVEVNQFNKSLQVKRALL